MSDRIAATEPETSRDTAAPPQNTSSSESNCFDADVSVRTAYFTGGPAAPGAALAGTRAGIANTSGPCGSLSTIRSKVTVETRSLPEADFRTLMIVLGNRTPPTRISPRLGKPDAPDADFAALAD